MASSVSTMRTDSVSTSVPLATQTRASANNPSTPVPSSSSSSSSLSSSLKRTVVSTKRKEELLLEARAERKRWIRTIPLPFDPELLLLGNNNHITDGKFKEDATNRLWSSREGLDRFQSSLVFRDRLLQGTTSILSELYGIGSALDDDDNDAGEEKDDGNDGDGGEDGKNSRKHPPNRPLSVDDVADRVDRLVSNNIVKPVELCACFLHP
jgi:hypothetical protein